MFAKAGGAEGSRTPDLLIANETLYQLSYDPTEMNIYKAFVDLCRIAKFDFAQRLA